MGLTESTEQMLSGDPTLWCEWQGWQPAGVSIICNAGTDLNLFLGGSERQRLGGGETGKGEGWLERRGD